MTVEKRLLLNYGYIREGFCRIFDFIDRYEIISASSGLEGIGFSNLSKSSVTRWMKQWTNYVKKKLSHYKEKLLHFDVDIKVAGQYETEFKAFSKKLDDFCITDVNTYLESVQKAIQENQKNTEVSNCLSMIEDTIKRKKRLIGELQKMINEQFSDLAKIGQVSMDYSKLRFDDSSLSLNEIRSRFNTFIIYESDSNNWERQWNIMNDFCLGEYINYSAKEIYEKMLEDLHAGNFENEIIYQVRKIDSKTFNIVDEYSKSTSDKKEI